MMSPVPDGPRIKLDRAGAHIEEAEAEFAALNEAHARPGSVQVKFDGTDYVVVSDPPRKPPDRIAAIVGDAVNNIRASLDYAVAEAIREGGNKPEKSAFPIVWSEKEWCSRVVSPDKPKNSPLWGLDPQGQAWAVIRGAQPYMSRQPQFTNLAVLGALSNRDKHDALLIQLAFPDRSSIEQLVAWNSEARLLGQTFPNAGQPVSFEQPAELLRLTFDASGPDPAVEMVGALAFAPMFGNERHQAPVGWLRDIRDYARELIDQMFL
jgi:hypothetical protein